MPKQQSAPHGVESAPCMSFQRANAIYQTENFVTIQLISPRPYMDGETVQIMEETTGYLSGNLESMMSLKNMIDQMLANMVRQKAAMSDVEGKRKD